MDNQQNTLARISDIVNKGKSGVIIIPPDSTTDTIAAASTLYLGLSKINKNLSLVCSQKPDSNLIGADKFQNVIGAGGDSLMISFPYTDGAIDKVDYNIQGEFFNLVVTPRAGYPKLNQNQVTFSYTGGVVDFIIVIDSPALNSLGSTYTEFQNLFTGRDIINIDRHLTNAYFGTVNYVNKSVSSISELILEIMQNIKIEIDRDMATNLYSGISAATNNFTSYSTNADTFENIASLLRLGAVKKTFKKPVKPATQSTINIGGPENQPTTPLSRVEKEKQPSQQHFEQKNPQDWLKPKIFKGGGLI